MENWPAWTESVSKVELLSQGPFALGSKVRITQPRLPTTDWTVTEFTPGRSFTWESKRAGMTTLAAHTIAPKNDGSTVTLSLKQTGLLAGIVALFYGKMSQRYVDMEANGLKRFSEGA